MVSQCYSVLTLVSDPVRMAPKKSPHSGGDIAAVATKSVASNSDNFLPRHVVVELSIKQHRAKMEEHSTVIRSMITQLSMHRDEYNEHKRLLQECLDEQAQFHTPTTAAAAAAEEPDDKDKESSSNDSDDDDDYVIDPTNIIATYDNTADAAATVTIAVKRTNHPMQLSPDTYVCILPCGSDV